MKRLSKKDIEFLKTTSEYYKDKIYNKKTMQWDFEKKKKINENQLKRKDTPREQVIKRDGYRCKTCGQNINLEVHHIIKLSEGGENDKKNLITLCSVCHYKIHSDEKIGKLMYKRLKKQGLIL